MKKISILILLFICYANIFGFGLHEINKMNEKNVTSLEFIDISGRDSDENKKYYSTDNKEIITKYIKDLKILKKEEIHYFGASYGAPTLKFKVVENGRVKYYKQIPIKEMESTIDEYRVFFKEYTLINCYVEKGLKLKSVIEYLDNHRYKYYPFINDISYEEPYCELLLQFKSSEQSMAVYQAQKFYKDYCKDQEINKHRIRIPSGKKEFDENGNKVFYSIIEIETNYYEVCKYLIDKANDIGIEATIFDSKYERFHMYIEDTFFDKNENQDLFKEIVFLEQKLLK